MNKQNYKLTFLPLFKNNLLEITDYITNTFQDVHVPDRSSLPHGFPDEIPI